MKNWLFLFAIVIFSACVENRVELKPYSIAFITATVCCPVRGRGGILRPSFLEFGLRMRSRVPESSSGRCCNSLGQPSGSSMPNHPNQAYSWVFLQDAAKKPLCAAMKP